MHELFENMIKNLQDMQENSQTCIIYKRHLTIKI